MNIVLTGFMASGKTTVGTTLSGRLNYLFIDTDCAVEHKYGMSISDIFKSFGEEHFRKLESETIAELSEYDNCIISTGGGAVLRSENIDMLRKNGKIVNLAPDFEVIAARIEEAAKTRPLMNGRSISEIKELFDKRRKYYDNCDFKIRITQEMSVDDCVNEIIILTDAKIKNRKDCIQ